MKTLEENLYSSVNNAVTLAVKQEKYDFDMYSFLKTQKYKRNEVIDFLESPLITAVAEEIYQLETYLNSNSSMQDLYGWMGRCRAQKFKEYLNKIINDLKKYEQEKRPGRKPGYNKETEIFQ
jgi:predicted component of type VI protein secretion system